MLHTRIVYNKYRFITFECPACRFFASSFFRRRAGHGGGGPRREYERNRDTTYRDSWHARRRRRGRPAGEQAVQSAQDRMEHDTHGGYFRRRTNCGTRTHGGKRVFPLSRENGRRKRHAGTDATAERRTEPRPRGLDCRAPTTVGRRAPRARCTTTTTHLPYGFHILSRRGARAPPPQPTYVRTRMCRRPSRTPLRPRGPARQTAHARAPRMCAHATTIHPRAPNGSPTRDRLSTESRPAAADYVTTPIRPHRDAVFESYLT